MTLRDEIKKQAEEIYQIYRDGIFDINAKDSIEQALLERHNKSVEMAAIMFGKYPL